MRDHSDDILDAIVNDMNAYQTETEQTAKSRGRGEERRLRGAGTVHARLRLETGYKLGQVVAEYRALRASVLRLWKAARQDQDHDIDGMTRFNEAIDEALTESTSRYLEMMELHRDEFIGVLGHDLRNPLGAMVMGAALLVSSEGLGEQNARIAARILSSGKRMVRLVSELLDLTRTRLGSGIPVTRVPTDLAPLCEQVIAELDYGHPGQTVRFAAHGDVRGEWDGDRLSQVVSNLVGNALQHGKSGAPVSLVVLADGEDVCVDVHNEGPAIPESAWGSIFEPMIRHCAQGGDRSPSGLGLGLYIAEQVVKAHDGTISLTSTDDLGTTFHVRLPRHPKKAVFWPAVVESRVCVAELR